MRAKKLRTKVVGLVAAVMVVGAPLTAWAIDVAGGDLYYNGGQTDTIVYSEIGRKAGISRNYMVKATVKVGGDTYTSGFILKDGRVLYMKDDDTTKNLENISSKAEFELYMEDLGGIVSEASVSGTEYVCGVFTDKDYVLEEYGTSNMEFYIVTAVIATILVFGCILIEFAGRIESCRICRMH